MTHLPRFLRKFLGIVGLGINWGLVWAGVFAVFVWILGNFRPHDIEDGEGSLTAGTVGLFFGLVTGVCYGFIVCFAEDRKPIVDLTLLRVSAWGAIASLVWPIVNSLPLDMVVTLSLLGAMYALLSLAIARRFEHRQATAPPWSLVVGRSLRDPLRATCAPGD